ncbi:hypothetical protein AB1046_09515 [Promicromonospora sp. Populi]|uniref:hypothetical protein n=1 Tax=Promicromonospora sp. Populi TaxID=3239420 RepID=UPI0034E27DCB
MDALALGLQRLDAAQTNNELVEALWDLRDSANDQSAVWSALTAEVVLQGLAYELEQTSADDDGEIPVRVLAQVLGKALDPRLREP